MSFFTGIKLKWRRFQISYGMTLLASDRKESSIISSPWKNNGIDLISLVDALFTNFCHIIFKVLEKTQNNASLVNVFLFVIFIKTNFTICKVVKLRAFFCSNLFVMKNVCMCELTIKSNVESFRKWKHNNWSFALTYFTWKPDIACLRRRLW